jgi:hypothetical protein
MSDTPSTASHRRLRALRAIPDAKRTEAQWDELNELEISLSPVNRIDRPARSQPANNAGRSSSNNNNNNNNNNTGQKRPRSRRRRSAP